VDRISWFDAVDFCNKLSEKEGLPLFYSRQGDSVTLQGGGGYRLPTEAEWEFACRAGTTTRWSFGDNDQVAARYAWIESAAAGRPHRAGELAANSFGLLDMDGNVWEWCCDWYGNYAAVDQRDPSGPVAGSKRVLRGGSFATSPWIVRSAVRNGDLPTIQYSHFGFRVARTCN
jgi:formylglycine-generating enzyme required for sulfatase activity